MDRSRCSRWPEYARWERGRTRGKVNPAALHKIPVGVDHKVFRKREIAQAFNTRVSLLVDHSGSMMGGRIALAARAASAFAEVLAQLRIPFEVLGFTSGRHGDGHRRYTAASLEDRQIFARWGALRTIVYKEFAENFTRVSGRLHSMSSFTGGEANYDGESVLIAARRLAQAARPEERRILFVFSDGCPAGTVTHSPLWERQAGHLHEAIRQVRATGTELFGIGIESNAVAEYYNEHVVVNSAEDLPRETVRALDKLLRRGLLRQAS
jgi:cobalamin biosynthesis protein CobT